MLNNVRYDKIKLLHKLSCIIWFIEKHGVEDAQTAGDKETVELMKNLKQDLQSYLNQLDEVACCKSGNGGCSSCK